MDDEPKHIAKATQEFIKGKKLDILQWRHNSTTFDDLHGFWNLGSRWLQKIFIQNISI